MSSRRFGARSRIHGKAKLCSPVVGALVLSGRVGARSPERLLLDRRSSAWREVGASRDGRRRGGYAASATPIQEALEYAVAHGALA